MLLNHLYLLLCPVIFSFVASRDIRMRFHGHGLHFTVLASASTLREIEIDLLKRLTRRLGEDKVDNGSDDDVEHGEDDVESYNFLLFRFFLGLLGAKRGGGAFAYLYPICLRAMGVISTIMKSKSQ